MKKIKFLFAVHNHQPVGNFDHVFEEIFNQCYKPYFEVLDRFRKIKTAVHFSGPLLEWLKTHHPEYMDKIAKLAAAGRIEILSGGFYEPLLSLLPEEDAIGQIRMMNDFIREEFGCTPRGLWLAERIWTPELPKIIAAAGIEYTVLDDSHFHYAGMEENQIHGYFVTEKLGSRLFIFPISKALRYAIPFKMPEDTLSILRRGMDEFGFEGVSYADDGEKFGGWPETHQWVYKEKWLEKFFTALEKNAGWIETATFGEYIDRHPPTGRVYLPMASYDEMMEWSLPTQAAWKFQDLKEELKLKGVDEEKYKLFLRGGQWDNFLVKYSESNQLHKKMLYVSRKVQKLSPKSRKGAEARRELYRGQCNCAQWHGLFGGLYLNYLRHALFQHLIAAENAADSNKDRGLSIQTFDFNLDGKDEVIVSNPKMNAYIAPAYGGGLFELDYRPACFNLSNVLRRREETYHKLIRETLSPEGKGGDQPLSIHDRIKFKEADLRDKLFFDRWERYSFLDHFLGPETTLENFKHCSFEEQGDFVDATYEIENTDTPTASQPFTLKLKRSGSVLQNGALRSIAIEKQFTFSPDEAEINVHYRIVNESKETVALWWGTEFNFTLLAGDAPDRYYTCPGHPLKNPRLIGEGSLENVKTFGLRDDYHNFQLTLTFSPRITLWRFPVETISQSEGGFERTYQGSCLLAHRQLELAGGKDFEVSIGLEITR